MRLSKLFTKTLREAPKDARALNHILLVRGGFISQLGSGLYSYLPLGFRVLKNIENYIRKELEKLGALEVNMSILHPAEVWKKTGRWHEIGKELWKIKSHEGEDMVLSMTHEEVIAEMAANFISTYHDLPRILNQFQIKFRDEERPRGGLLRLKEFIMQDAYSFDKSEKDLDATYQKFYETYLEIFKGLDLNVIPVKALSGIMGGSESHEFMLPAEVGEDKILLCKRCNYAANIEAAETETCPTCGGSLTQERAIELGHTFKLGVKYSEPFGIYFEDVDGIKKLTVMGSYGIGLDRLMASIVEVHSDEKGIIWPSAVAPFRVHLISLDGQNLESGIKSQAEKVYNDLVRQGIEVLYDDREGKTAGEKFADADLIGCPVRLVVSKKTLEKNSVELKLRNEKDFKLVKLAEIYKAIR
ncbi:MAG: proline--tRNA ligase [Candidatus Yanofskybacteria bacterium]|nr:proline--tRNA ligase [Candidatus Yanofskybacteria bacterium]